VKKELVLQPRLYTIASLVPNGARLADVGTDHGFIPVSLLLQERIKCAIASDIGAAPLEHARRTAEQFGVTDCIEFRLCDGLCDISAEEVDTIVIAGMGGDNISAILGAAPWTKNGALLLLQPMSKAEVLRRYLPENGYQVVAEQLVADKGVIYPILTVRGGRMTPASDAQTYGGFLLKNDPLQRRYLDERILSLRRAASGLEKSKNPEAMQKRKVLLEVISDLEKQRGECCDANRT